MHQSKQKFHFAASFVRRQVNQPCKYKVTASSHSRSIKTGNRETPSLAVTEGNKVVLGNCSEKDRIFQKKKNTWQVIGVLFLVLLFINHTL